MPKTILGRFAANLRKYNRNGLCQKCGNMTYWSTSHNWISDSKAKIHVCEPRKTLPEKPDLDEIMDKATKP